MREIDTSSVKQTLQVQSALRERMSGEHTGGARFAWKATHTPLRDLVISQSEYTGAVRGRAHEVAKYWLSITLAEGGSVVQGGAAASCGVGAGNILSPGMPAEMELGDGFRGLLVGIPAPLVTTALGALDGREVATPPRFDLEVDFRTGAAAEVARLVQFLAGEAARGSGLLATPAIAAHLEEALVHAVLRLPRAGSASAPPPSGNALALVRRAEEYLAANAAAPVTLAEVAGVAGVAIRTLQAAFRRHRRSTPMEFLRARRFDLARSRLASGDPATIAEIALDCGFTHLGRFSTAYRARFGERPSETRLSSSRERDSEPNSR